MTIPTCPSCGEGITSHIECVRALNARLIRAAEARDRVLEANSELVLRIIRLERQNAILRQALAWRGRDEVHHDT